MTDDQVRELMERYQKYADFAVHNDAAEINVALCGEALRRGEEMSALKKRVCDTLDYLTLYESGGRPPSCNGRNNACVPCQCAACRLYRDCQNPQPEAVGVRRRDA